MDKPFLLYQAPVSTRSGYGDHARDVLRALKDLDKYEIKIISTRWGVTPMDQLDPSKDFDRWVLSNIITKVERQPDIFMQMTIPNEFQTIGKFNIGITAGIETTFCPKDWIDGVNRMNLTIATSEHTRRTLLQTVYQERRSDTNQIVNEHKIQKPIEVLHEGIDYKETNGLEILDLIKENFCFLFVGHWLSGDLYHDRKDVGGMIQTFLASFSKLKTEKPALVLKISSAGFSVRDREEMKRKIEAVKEQVKGEASIYLLHGDLNEEDMWKLYNHSKIKALLCFTHGEGFGRPILEFSLTGKPLLVSGWSGQVDFITESNFLLEGELKNVHETAANQFILKEAQWFYTNYSKASLKLLDLYQNYEKYYILGKKLAEKNKKDFSYISMKEKLNNIFEKFVKIQKKIELKLPQLKKVSV